MKVLMISRSNWLDSVGGDTIQAQKTALYLQKLGVEVEFYSGNKKPIYRNYQLIHFFNIIRPHVILEHCKRSKIPFVVSTIYVDYSEVDRRTRGPLLKGVQQALGSDFVEYLKTIARATKGNEKLGSWKYLLWGHKQSIKTIIKNANLLLPNSESEARRLFAAYNIKAPYRVIPNGIDPEEYPRTVEYGNRDGVLCVGRIEPRKNQLNLIKAVQQTPYKLTIVGDPSPNHRPYFESCQTQALLTPNQVKFIPFTHTSSLVSLYQKSKVHALPSWFETTGLVNLEAAVCGCNLVISANGDTRDYFGNRAIYCQPAEVESIKNALIKAYKSANNNELRTYILSRFTWQIAAEKTYRAYQKALYNEDT